MGLETDVRAGGVRVDPSGIVARPTDLTPAVAMMVDGFRRGFVTTQDIFDRFSQKSLEQEAAATETARVQKETARAITPELIQSRVTAEQGGLEAQIAQQQLMRETRAPREALFKAEVAQAYDELQSGLPGEVVRKLEFQYPHIIKPRRDAQGVVLNPEEVRSQIAHAVQLQKFMDTATDLSSRFESKEVQTPGGQEGLQTFWKGTSDPVPPEVVRMVNSARTGQLFQAVQPGQVVAPGAPPVPGAAPAAPQVPAAPAAPAAAAPEASPPTGLSVYQPGTMTPEGVFITKGRAGGKLTEVEGKALKFYRRMEESEQFFTQMQNQGFEPTKLGNQAWRDIWATSSKVPVLGAYMGAVVPEDAKSYHNVVQGFTSAMLRDESGAAIRDDERAEYERMMFPLSGEPAEVVAQKAKLRATVMASLKQVASGQISDEAYEHNIEAITGRQFPAPTSTRGAYRLGEAANQGIAPDDIPRIRPGDPIPTSGWFWVEGEAQPRKVFGAPASAAPQGAPAASPAPRSSVPIYPNPRFDLRTPTSNSGIRG